MKKYHKYIIVIIMVLGMCIIADEPAGSGRDNNVNVEVNINCKMQEITAIVTAYTAGQESTGKTRNHRLYGITASGLSVTEYYTIAMDKSVPFGTKVYIPYFKDAPNKGWFTVTDRGGAIRLSKKPKGVHKVDIYMSSYAEAKRFGRKELTIYIMDNQGGLYFNGKSSEFPM